MTYTKTHATRFLAIAILVLFAACACGSEPQPRSVILLIGDGMGIGAITAARCAGPGENGKLVLGTMPVTGLVKTHPQGNLVTDSAASGTALAAGHKTLNGRISMDSGGKSLPTILELATKMGKSTGVVTTDAVTGATPAVFYAHADQRGKQDDIAAQLVTSKMSVAMGSGKQFFVPAAEGVEARKDGLDLTVQAAQNGFEVVYDASAMEASKSRRLLGLFVFDDSGPTFEAMTAKAVSILDANPKGFFLMAESCLPDKGGHKNDVSFSVKGVADLDAALKRVLDFAAKDGKTLVLVTADHETGGLAVLDRNDQNPSGTPGWVHKSHTGNMVPVYAFGPGAEKFGGTHDNTEIPKIIAGLWQSSLDQ
jgi:alkaline phosphatase